MALKNLVTFSLVLLIYGLILSNGEFAGSAKYKEPGKSMRRLSNFAVR